MAIKKLSAVWIDARGMMSELDSAEKSNKLLKMLSIDLHLKQIFKLNLLKFPTCQRTKPGKRQRVYLGLTTHHPPIPLISFFHR